MNDRQEIVYDRWGGKAVDHLDPQKYTSTLPEKFLKIKDKKELIYMKNSISVDTIGKKPKQKS